MAFKAKFLMYDLVKDTVTGFMGTITSYCFSCTGPTSVMVEAASVDGKPGESAWFDEDRLVYA